MLEYGSNAALIETFRAASMGDKKVLDATRAHRSSLDRWRTSLEPSAIAEIVETLGSRLFDVLGYRSTLELACQQAGLVASTVAPEGRLPELLEAFHTYGRTAARATAADAPGSSVDVQYTLLGQRTDELQQAAEERLDLIQQLTSQLEQLQADAVAKEHVISGLRAAGDERLEVIEVLNARLEELQGCVARRSRAIRRARQGSRGGRRRGSP